MFNIREALNVKSRYDLFQKDDAGDVYAPGNLPPDELFSLRFREAGGKIIRSENREKFLDHLHILLSEIKSDYLYCDDELLRRILTGGGVSWREFSSDDLLPAVAVIRCEFIVARTGSILTSTGTGTGRILQVFPLHQIILAFAEQIIPDIDEALSGLTKKYAGNLPSQVTLVTGPSRTADIEKTLVLGAHGPKEVHLFLVNQEPDKFFS